MAKKKRLDDLPAPRSRDEADRFIYDIGVAIRDRSIIQHALDSVVAKAKADFEGAAAPINESIEQLTKGLQTFCEANRAVLLDGHSKTITFGNGTVAWRARPASVTLRNVEKIIEWCQTHLLRRFVRMKAEINKEAMLSEPDEAKKVPGVKIESDLEDFIVEPIAVPLQEVA